MSEELRVLERTWDAEYVERRSGTTAAANDGNTLPEDSNEATDSSELEDEWNLFQIDDIGVNTHITLGCTPIEMTNVFCAGITGRMGMDLEGCYIAQCDYN